VTINDAHCHFFSEGFFGALAKEKAAGGAPDSVEAITSALEWDAPGEAARLADRWIQELDTHQVSRAALIASVPGDEASVGDAVTKHPDRVVGLFMVNPKAPDATERVRRGLTELGLHGVCLFPAMHKFALDSTEATSVFETAAEHGTKSVFVHCGVLSVGVRKKLGLPSRFDIRLGDPLALVPVATAHPKTTFVIPHFGAGFFREALMAADLCPNIVFDTSSTNGWIMYQPGLTLTDVFRAALDVVGPTRLMFGTDSSFFPRGWQKPIHEHQLAILKELGVEDEEQAQIFGGTFARIYGT
jgi:predicted TIM-barrel fold metal-dependent hydrolase